MGRKKEFKGLISDKDYNKFHKCLANYKAFLRSRFSKQNKEKLQLKKELQVLTNIEKDFFSEYYGGGIAITEKQKGKKMKKCVEKFAKALDKEEKLLQDRLKKVQLTKRSLMSNMEEVLR